MASNCNKEKYGNNEEYKKDIILRFPNFDLNNLKYWNWDAHTFETFYGKLMRAIMPFTIIGGTIGSTILLFNNMENECNLFGKVFFSGIFGPFLGFFMGGFSAICFPITIPSWITLFFLTRK